MLRSICVMLLGAVLGGIPVGAQAAVSDAALREYVGQYRPVGEPDQVSTINLEGDRIFVEGEPSVRM